MVVFAESLSGTRDLEKHLIYAAVESLRSPKKVREMRERDERER
jgi:hypothetical protein